MFNASAYYKCENIVVNTIKFLAAFSDSPKNRAAIFKIAKYITHVRDA